MYSTRARVFSENYWSNNKVNGDECAVTFSANSSKHTGWRLSSTIFLLNSSYVSRQGTTNKEMIQEKIICYERPSHRMKSHISLLQRVGVINQVSHWHPMYQTQTAVSAEDCMCVCVCVCVCVYWADKFCCWKACLQKQLKEEALVVVRNQPLFKKET